MPEEPDELIERFISRQHTNSCAQDEKNELLSSKKRGSKV
jgi:hypothetical protein